MAQPKIKPSQAWFGFDDPELKTPAHDALMLWIDDCICEILVEVLGLTEEPIIVTKQWEQIIQNKRGFTVGVADLGVRIRCGQPPFQEDSVIFVEAKSQIRSLGELIRQIHYSDANGDLEKFTTHAISGKWRRPQWLVIAPDDRFAKTLREQGILFYKSPTL